MRLKPAGLALQAIAALVLLAGCSSAPKPREQVDSVKNQAAQYAAAGNAFFGQGNYPQAQKFFDLALQTNLSVYNLSGIATSYNSLGKVYLAVGDLAAAETDFQNALGVARQIHDAGLTGQTESNLGEVDLARGSYHKALETFNRALARTEDPNSPLAARLDHNIGAAYKGLGDFPSALAFLHKAAEAHLALKDEVELSSDYYMIASVYSKERDYRKATESAEKALAGDEKMENSPGIAADLLALGIIAEKAGNPSTAYSRYYASFQVYKSIGLLPEVKELLGRLVRVARRLGLTEDAASYERALKSLSGGGS